MTVNYVDNGTVYCVGDWTVHYVGDGTVHYVGDWTEETASRCRSRRSSFFSSGFMRMGTGTRDAPPWNPVGDVDCENDELKTTEALLAAAGPGEGVPPGDDWNTCDTTGKCTRNGNQQR